MTSGGTAVPLLYRLPSNPQVPRAPRARLVRDFERFKQRLPGDVPSYVREQYRVELAGRYAGCPIKLPFGKASGQLSMTVGEVKADAEAGLGFVVLKTLIAQDEHGERSMEAWAIAESAMQVERIRSRSGRDGWTVTWKGRGWDRSFDEYLALYREALEIGEAAKMPVAASVKGHLPVESQRFKVEEYECTTQRLAEVGGPGMILEKDFSPTLAGDARAAAASVLRWIREVPALIKRVAPVQLGLKLMNAMFDDAFQVEMVQAASQSGADFLVLFNRLFDPEKQVAYGGWDLSDRNLRVLDLAQGASPASRGASVRRCVGTSGFSATGNICSGRMMLEYALRGATSGQIHTYFQLPLGEYPATAGSRTQRALHALVFHPEDGLVAWLLHLGETAALEPRAGLLHFLDIAHESSRHTA